jgi:GR25 family glycosyltransferase involved in LPS biosynthesis
MRQLKALGLPLPDETDFIRWFYAVPFPHNALIADAFNKSRKGRFTKANEFDCARNHYSIVKIARDTFADDEHVLVLEDDILLPKDASVLSSYLKALPDDYDIAQLGGFTVDPKIHEYMKSDELWVKHRNVGVWNASGYALSNRGMEFYITFMDSVLFWVADGPLYKAPLSDKIVNTYISREPLVIQASKERLASDIRNADNDRIDYDNQNEYERDIDLDKFFSL